MILISPAQCVRAASAYRALIRAQKFTFKGDDFALQAAHQQTRIIFNRIAPSAHASTSFLPSSSSASPAATPAAPPTTAEIDENIQSAFEIATYLRRNVVQGIKTEEGKYALRFTPETERGDNDTIKAPSLNEARPLRPPLEKTGNEGVKRRRRGGPKVVPEAEGVVTGGSKCC